MSERKGINRYYPPNVDPSKVKFSHKKAQKSKGQNVRLMMPFSIKCLKCEEYIAKSRKFNARKEVTDRDYLGIKIKQFSIRCPRCFSELVFETDPKLGDYTCVVGCKKNFERDNGPTSKETIDEMIARLEKEEKEEERMRELKRKGGNSLRNGKISEETGMEQLEKRLAEQEKERERIEELEDLQKGMEDLEKRRAEVETAENNIAADSEEDREMDKEAKEAFKHKGKRWKSNPIQPDILNGYSDSEESSDSEDHSVGEELDSKRESSQIRGVLKRRKINIIT